MKDHREKEIAELKIRLAEAEKEKAALLKVVSHDLRSPMNKLFALIGLFKMSGDSLNEEQLNYLDKMELVITDGLTKMRNVMDLRAIEGKGVETVLETLNIGKLTAKVLNDFTISLNRKQINFVFKEEPISVYTDKLSCQRILKQLISNAVKYSPTGSTIQIEITTDEEKVIIQVIDGGYGISAEEQLNLFKKFSILSTRPTGGESVTGIGLYIAQWMAGNIGGNIEYNNENGSRFILQLPKTEVA